MSWGSVLLDLLVALHARTILVTAVVLESIVLHNVPLQIHLQPIIFCGDVHEGRLELVEVLAHIGVQGIRGRTVRSVSSARNYSLMRS